jgi:pimeloyl-ACP methyl ester carboxylesterase
MTGRQVLGAMFAAAGLASCAPFSRDISYATLETRYANAASQYMDMSDGVRMHYRTNGPAAAPALVLAHGFGASLHTWEPWVERLQAHYSIISVDFPGHGLTRAPDGYAFSASSNAQLIEELTQRLHLQRFTLVGHSMGGAVAVRYALLHPERLNALVLVDAAAWPSEARAGQTPFAFQMLRNPIGRAILSHVNPRLFAERGLVSAYHDRAMVSEAVVDRYVDLARAPGHRALLSSDRNNRADPPLRPDDFAAITVATLVMHGEHDRIVSVQDSRALAAAIPGARLILYPGASHMPMEENPIQSAADLRAFLEAPR